MCTIYFYRWGYDQNIRLHQSLLTEIVNCKKNKIKFHLTNQLIKKITWMFISFSLPHLFFSAKSFNSFTVLSYLLTTFFTYLHSPLCSVSSSIVLTTIGLKVHLQRDQRFEIHPLESWSITISSHMYSFDRPLLSYPQPQQLLPSRKLQMHKFAS